MNIIPISSGITPVGPAAGGENKLAVNENTANSFSDVLKNAIDNIENLEEIKNQDSYNLAIGNVDDLAQVAINSQKYDMSVQLMVQIRNKLLDSYSEVMRMNI